MKLLSVVLLLLPLSACLAEVVDDFTVSCPQFFPPVDGTASPPTRFIGSRFKQICQTRNNQPEFATFYDTENKIPVYSSYTFDGRVSCERKSAWFIEPRLEVGGKGAKMASEAAVRKEVVNVENQALNGDYKYSVYDKGHLLPVYLAHTQSCSDATFTLTNAAPQHYSFNRGQWKKTEETMAVVLKADCINKGLSAYVVTGVVPGNDTLNNRVRIPSHYWTAFCCLDQNNKFKLSGGYIGENSKDNLEPIRNSVQDLERHLTGEYKKHFPNQIPNKAFTLFDGKCHETAGTENQNTDSDSEQMGNNRNSSKRRKLANTSCRKRNKKP
ncbi:endonuclease domain-containing 1 protein-like [Pangasianodon hypophthalmus]|uniref:endonuclease domain-containing 1 protein-like n=1 Tax=Pangasianodon hypophthalmus TaxID=310915 RepID=UPI002307A510|nr:endonuclease domain-containing 1 protein-like [Pangasianodon hypophthalmus]